MESTEICEAGNDHPADIKITVRALVNQIDEPCTVFACWGHLSIVLVNLGVGARVVNRELMDEANDN